MLTLLANQCYRELALQLTRLNKACPFSSVPEGCYRINCCNICESNLPIINLCVSVQYGWSSHFLETSPFGLLISLWLHQLSYNECQGPLALNSTAELVPIRTPNIPPAESFICFKGQRSFSYLKKCKNLAVFATISGTDISQD